MFCVRTSLVGLAVLAGFTAMPLWSQLGTATISGNVTDTTGAVVAGAVVTSVNHDTGFRRQTASTSKVNTIFPG